MKKPASPNPVTAGARRSRLTLHAVMVMLALAFTALFSDLAVQLSSRLRIETFHQYRMLAEEVTSRFNESLDVKLREAAGPSGSLPKWLATTETRPLAVTRLEGGRLVLAARDDPSNRMTLAEPAKFFEAVLGSVFQSSSMGPRSFIDVLYGDKELVRLSPVAQADGKFIQPDSNYGREIYRSSLNAPFDGFSVVFRAVRIPIAKSGTDARALVGVILMVLPAGLGALYLFALKQVDLAEERSRFVAAVSHELRTPLTSIRMFAEMLRDGVVQHEDKKREYASLIASEGERLSNLVADLLDLSRFARGLRRLQMRELAVHELFDLAVARTRPLFEQGKVECVTSVEIEEDVSIRADEEAFLRVWINLADNAVKYGASGEFRRVEFRVAPRGKRVIFSMRDYGKGFESKAAPRPGSTGIGLALVRETVKRMGGSLRIHEVSPGVCVETSFKRASGHK